MTNNDWIVRARQFLNTDARVARAARSEAELRTAVMDTHAALEDVLRGYLTVEYSIVGLGNKSEWNFPSVVNLLREKTGSSVLDVESSRKIMDFNGLRNRVVHDRTIPTYQDVQDGIALTSGVLLKLLKDKQTAPAWQIPLQAMAASLARTLGSDLSFGLAGIMILFALLYVINPVDLPGPLDDIAIAGPCIFSAYLLIRAANALKNNSSKRK
jgi:hypothetical protein